MVELKMYFNTVKDRRHSLGFNSIIIASSPVLDQGSHVRLKLVTGITGESARTTLLGRVIITLGNCTRSLSICLLINVYTYTQEHKAWIVEFNK